VQPSSLGSSVWGRAWLPPPYKAEQFFFDALIDPSLHKNNSPSQRSIPPFFPEQGVLPAQANTLAIHSSNKRIGIPPRRITVRTVQLPIRVMAK
jgi:hypothetical protein